MTAKLTFGGHPLAVLFGRECAESLDGLCTHNLLHSPSAAWPAGFVHASPPPQGWSNTMWTRDAGVFLRELILWGRVDDARLVATCLLDLVERNAKGFFSFPERFQEGHPRHGTELDGTSAIVIAFVLFAQRLAKQDPLGGRLAAFLAASDGPLAFMVEQLGARPLLEGSGEFGPGCYLKGTACNVVQNSLCALALESGARWAATSGQDKLAAIWGQAAATLRKGIDTHLVASDGGWLWCVDPVTLKPDPAVLDHVINRGFGGINGVACMNADVHGFLCSDTPWRRRCEATLDRLVRNPQRAEAMQRWGMWTQFDELAASGRLDSSEHRGELTSPSYGHGYATQALLLFDRAAMAARALDGLAENTFDKGQRLSPYYFHERMYAPPRPLAARDGCGELNLVCAAEPLKVARMVAGFDDHDPARPAWIPRLPAHWPNMCVEDWPLLTDAGWFRIDAGIERLSPTSLRVRLSVRNDELRQLEIRAGGSGPARTYHLVRELREELPVGD